MGESPFRAGRLFSPSRTNGSQPGFASSPGHLASQIGRYSDAPEESERAWRDALFETALGLLFGATILAGLFGMVVPRPRFDSLVALFFGHALPIGVAWRLRRLPQAARVGLAFLPLLGLAFQLFTRVGFVQNVATLLAIASALLALWLGIRYALAYACLCGLCFVAAGVSISLGHPRLDDSFVDPYRMANWTRTGVTFVLMTTVLVVCISWIVDRVEKNARGRAKAHDLLRLLNRRLENAKEEERRHLARELHDEFGQSLTAIKLMLKLAERQSPEVSSKLASATDVVDELIRRVRQLSLDLSPPLLQEAGLVAAIRAFVETQAGLADLAIDLDLTVEGRFPGELETTIFRVVQESITNALRHAHATRLRVVLHRLGGELFVSVADDGSGYDLDEVLQSAARGEHFGVVGMRERVRGLGGSFAVDSGPGQGTAVSATFPVAAPL
jgi:signal transduction histidine kinase